jgi:hypothetical protein
MATLRVSEASIRPSCKPLSISDPAPEAKNASGSGLAIGRSTILVMPSIFYWGSALPSLFLSRRSAKAHSSIAYPADREQALVSVKIAPA